MLRSVIGGPEARGVVCLHVQAFARLVEPVTPIGKRATSGVLVLSLGRQDLINSRQYQLPFPSASVRLVLCSFFALRGLGSVQFGLICRQHFVARSLAPNLGSPYRKENRSLDNAFCPDLHTRIGAVLWVKQLVVGVVPRPGLPPPPAFDRCGQASFAIPDSPGSALSWLAPHIALLLPDIPVSLFSLLIVSIPQWTPSGKSNIDVQQSEQSNFALFN